MRRFARFNDFCSFIFVVFFAFFFLFFVNFSGSVGVASAQNPSGWGRRSASPTVVNPAVLAPSQRVLSLRGAWEFQTDPTFNALRLAGTPGGIPEDFWTDAATIQVPGCWEAQGVGEPGISETWDCFWDCNPRPLRHIYKGNAIYRKKVEIPKNWEGCEIWLKIGGVRTAANFWVDGVPIGVVDNFCGTYKFNVTEFVSPGETAEILASVRNDIPSRKGQMCDFHKFGGMYRDVELEATPKTWIDDVWVQGKIVEIDEIDDENGTGSPRCVARVRTTLRTVCKREHVDVSVAIQTLSGKTLATTARSVEVVGAPEGAEADFAADAEETIFDIPVADAALWSPESPTLYLAQVEIRGADGARHGWVERFGFRELKVVGDRFFLNGKPYFIRGYGETFVYPETLVSPADRDAHRRNFALVKEAGFNQTRMHTHCELPEYFEAADEAGVLIQPELPYYSDVPTEGFAFDPLRDIKELYRHYRRYASFAFYSTGNEGGFAAPLDREIYRWAKTTDPDRPIQHQDGGRNTSQNSDFATAPFNVWPRGQYDELTCPFVAHEYLNLSVKLDPRLEPLFTGAIPSPVSVAEYETRLEELGLSRVWGDACIRAAHSLQAYYQKEGLEAARRDPACDGYNFWNFIDQMVVQNGAYTSQGYLNAFYRVKDGGLTPSEFAKFNSPNAVLAEFLDESFVFVGGDAVAVDFWIACFGDALPDGAIDWELVDVDDASEIVVDGSVPFDAFEVGDVRLAASREIPLPEVERPFELRLKAKIRGTETENSWSIWIFPKREKPMLESVAVAPEFFEFFASLYDGIVEFGTPEAEDAAVLVAPFGSESCERGVAQGRRVLAIRQSEGADAVRLGWWAFGNQLGTAFADSPAFGDFPHNGVLNPLWFRLIKDDPFVIADAPGFYEPLAVGELVDGYSLYVGERREGDAKILATFGIDFFQDAPEARALLDAAIQYVGSDEFNPIESRNIR